MPHFVFSTRHLSCENHSSSRRAMTRIHFVSLTSKAAKPLSMAKKSPSAIDRQVGARVRMRRLILDMSQEQLAAGLGISFQQVQKYERGVNRIGASRLQQIADVLQVPASFFFEDL